MFDAAGKPGITKQLTGKDNARAVAVKKITTETPEFTETLKLTKQFYDNCVTEDWSGIAGNSGAVSALAAIKPGDAAAGFTQGEWGTLPRMGATPGGPPGTTTVSLYDGYLLGSKSLQQEQPYLQDLWDKGVAYQVKTNKWGDEDWAKGVN